MFWNDPNLYSVAFKDIPNVPTPFGQIPRFFNTCPVGQNLYNQPVTPFATFNPYLHTQPMNPWVNPIVNTPVTPFAGINPYLPTQTMTPFQGINPYLHTQAMNPWINPTMTTPYLPYNYNVPFYGYRPFPY